MLIYKMKFRCIVLYILLLLVQAKVASSENTLSEKYFQLRKRLVNEFTLGVGADFGQSIPAFVKRTSDRKWQGSNTIAWSDATIDLSYYIGTLATEYLLLSKESKNTDSTLYELYYAMEAFNRLDYYAEEYYGYPAALNGFFVRNDVGRNLYNNKSKTPAYSENLKRLNTFKNDSLNNIESEWVSYKFYGDNKRYAMSKDQVFHLFMAMKLVVKCLPENLNYQQKKFKDGETSFTKEAKNITDRIMQWIHPETKSNLFTNWRLRLPNGKKTGAGYNAWTFARGMSLCQQKISGTKNPKQNGLSWWWAKAVYNFTWFAFKPIYFFNRSEGTKTLTLITISNSSCNAEKVYRYSFFSEKYPNIHIPLLNEFLNDKISTSIDFSFYKKIFEEMPDQGPHNLVGGVYANYNWSSTSLMIHPERRGQQQVFFPGNYNGLDYMFLYNLYLLCKKEGY